MNRQPVFEKSKGESGAAYKVALGSLSELLLGSISQVRIYCRLACIRLDRQTTSTYFISGGGRGKLTRRKRIREHLVYL
jgi:hypothetical protein